MNAIGESNLFQDIGLGVNRGGESDRTKDATDLDATDYLSLLIAQISNQDPFEPMENGAFISQLAEFGTVSGIDELKQSFDDFGSSIFSGQGLQAANLVGRSVRVPAGAGLLSEDKPITGAVDLPNNSSSLNISIFNAQGSLINSFNLGEQTAGHVEFSWDGLAADDSIAEPGGYFVVAEAAIGGEVTAVETLLDLEVASVTLEGAGQPINLNLANGNAVAFSEVREIK